MVNGQEYAWASLFAKLDRFVTLQERHTIENMMHSRHMREAIEHLPQRIANAILVSQAVAARTESASGLSGWTELVKSLSRLAQRGAWLLALLLLVVGRIELPDLAWLASLR